MTRWRGGLFPLLLFAALEFYTRTIGRGSDSLAPPSAAARALVTAASDGSLWEATRFTLGCAAMGLAVGALLALLLGVALGLSARASRMAFLSIEVFRPVPSVALVPLAMLIWGFGLARQQPVQLWNPPIAMRHVAALLTLISFVLLAAAYVPGNGIKARLHHPMVLAVKVWALAHLLANGNLAHVLLFGSFLLWAIVDYASARRRDRAAGTRYPRGRAGATGITVFVGLAGWVVFAFWLHGMLIGISPLG